MWKEPYGRMQSIAGARAPREQLLFGKNTDSAAPLGLPCSALAKQPPAADFLQAEEHPELRVSAHRA